MGKTYVVVGSGFRGFCDAAALLNKGGNTVHIIEAAPFFGGLSYSRKVGEFYVDKGVHVFDSIPQNLADIVNDIMDGQTTTIDFVSASAFNGAVTEGFSLPDLSSLDEATKVQIKTELLALAAQGSKEDAAKNLYELFLAKFGPTAGEIFAQIFEKVYSISSDQIDKAGMAVTSLHRLKFLDDEAMVELKKDAWLDTVLAARRQSMGKIDDLVSIYPYTGEAMRGWCDRAVPWLEARGGVIHLGEKVEAIKNTARGVEITTDKQTIAADHIIWSNDNLNALAGALGMADFDARPYQHGTPMLFATMVTQADKIKDFTYIQNFNLDGRTYRTASSGLFSNQVTDDGRSFITSECPVVIGSEAWNDPEAQVQKIWQEVMDLGVVAKDATLVDHEIIAIPSTFKPAKIGYKDQIARLYDEVPKRSSRVLLRDPLLFFRRQVYLDSLNLQDCLDEQVMAA